MPERPHGAHNAGLGGALLLQAPAGIRRGRLPRRRGRVGRHGHRLPLAACSDPGGYAITDYEFELSRYPDIRWPLSTNFYRLISRTGDKGKSQYTLRCAGLLTPGATYYWRVRAKDAEGVWGPWSQTWSFKAEGPAYPLDVTMDYDAAAHRGVLSGSRTPWGVRP